MLSDEALYDALIRGDLRAFDTLYDRHADGLFGFIRKHVPNTHQAEDVLHETFIALLKDRAGARAAHSLRAWLYQVARHLCLNSQRSQRRESRALEVHSPPEADAGPDLVLEQHQSHRSLREAVNRLPQLLAELYALRSRGLSYEEMADILAIPVGTVKSRMHKMVSHLREEMQR